MNLYLNYKHLFYFWVVAKEGGMVRAADRLGMSVQTVSTQVRDLERSLGHTLLKPAGRGLILTDAGRAALAQAEQIFNWVSNCLLCCVMPSARPVCVWRWVYQMVCLSW